MQQAGEHFEGGRFARAVGAEEADQFAFLNGEADVVNGDGLLVAAMEKAAHSAAKARFLFVGAKGLGQSRGLRSAAFGPPLGYRSNCFSK